MSPLQIRIQAQGLSVLANGVYVVARFRQNDGYVILDLCVVGLQAQRLPVVRHGVVQIAEIDESEPACGCARPSSVVRYGC